MFRPLFLVLAMLATCAFAGCTTRPSRPLKALLITGGCCHNYPLQSAALTSAIQERANVGWTIVQEGGNGTRGQIGLYDNPNWAAPYDVIVHNECFADTDDLAYIRKITAAHQAGKPAMVIHCAMHTYRASTSDEWREFLGVTSRRHDHQSRYPVRVVAPEHPVMRGFPTDWVTQKDELYIIEKVWPGTTPLAVSASELNGQSHPVAWVNNYRGTRVFGTSYGHSDDAFRDPRFLDLLSRGFLWTAGRLK